MKMIIITYGAVILLLLILFQLLQLTYWQHSISLEVYLIIVAALGIVGGIYAGKSWRKKDHQEKASQIKANFQSAESLGLSKRETEILQEIAAGKSNQEIADQLFLSVNTVKTHTKNVYAKLEVQRRTQAVQKARELQIIPS